MQGKIKEISGLTGIVIITMMVVQYVKDQHMDWTQIFMVTVIFLVSTTLGNFY
ncbi:hypothetical protein LMF32_02210 [Desemzia sp. C1]|uniref:hypothetical protein n=1 Tax=Desemzia sp. C1 TaxID=2892016 RepID=UPI001E5C7F0C|nr:hypothetical protein [Desemzia sp. C1]MCI3027945.1 hypothetical protein [Desemzia sp. C1]